MKIFKLHNKLKSLPRLPIANSHIPYSKHGFTLVEMLIIAPIVILVIGVFISAIISMTGNVLVVRKTNALAYNIQQALSQIDQDVSASSGYLALNNVSLTSPQGYNNDTTNFKNADATNGTMLILNTYATTANPISSTRSYVYATSQPYACASSLVNQNAKITMNIIYFVKMVNGVSSLWRRVVAPSNYANLAVSCSVPWQQPSCVPGYNPVTYPFCKTQDTRLVDGVAAGGFTVNYFESGSTTANTVAGDSTQTDGARQIALRTTNTVSVKIDATSTTAGRNVTQSGTIRAISPNNTTSTGDVTWSSFSMSSGWTDYDTTPTGYNTNGYRRTKYGVVILKGLIKRSSAIVAYETIATLPSGYRPAEQSIFETTTNPNTFSRIDVYPDGRITSVGAPVGDAGWLSLENIKFLASNSPSSFTTLTPLNNGWLAYGSPFPSLFYAFDGDGRVHTKGLIKNGTITNETPIANLPANARPSEYLHIATSAHNGTAYIFGFMGIGSDILGGGNILAKGIGVTGSTWLSTQSMFFPSSYTDWIGMPLNSGWSKYACTGCTTPKYTKAPDGLVSLVGLAANTAIVTLPCATTGTAFIATLPVGYRPAKRILFGTATSSQFSRLDVDASGNIMICSGLATTTANTWVDLDGLTFYADQ